MERFKNEISREGVIIKKNSRNMLKKDLCFCYCSFDTAKIAILPYDSTNDTHRWAFRNCSQAALSRSTSDATEIKN